MTHRTYHEVAGADQSGVLEQVLAQRRRVRERLAQVAHVVAVMSGKGGVGKSFVTAGLARALAVGARRAVGVLDGDLGGPTVARLLGAVGPLVVDGGAVRPALGEAGIRVVSMDLLLDEGQPLRWRQPATDRYVARGTLEAGAVREFLGDVAWGALDVLLVDLPPGAERAPDLAEIADVAGALAVTIPSEESRHSVARAMRAATEGGVRLLGVIENMSGYACPGCGTLGPLFAGDAGQRLAGEFAVPLLGRIPFVPPGGGAATFSDIASRLLEGLS